MILSNQNQIMIMVKCKDKGRSKMSKKNIELFFKPHDDRKATISIRQKDYLVSTHFSMRDGERYIEELKKENDYRKAFAKVVVEKIAEGDYEEIPSV